MIVLPDYRIVFLERPRCASRAMNTFLCRHLGGRPVDPANSHYIKLPPKYRGYRVVCGMRNPYSRVYSRFGNSLLLLPKGKQKSFERFVRQGRGERLSDFLAIAGVSAVTAVIRFEGLPKSLFRTLKSLGVAGPYSGNLARVGKSTGREWQQFYNQRRADLVWNAAREDFEDYGYARDSWKSRELSQ